MRKAWSVAILIVAALALVGCGQSPERLNNDGNEAFEAEDYQGALTAYLQAQDDAPELAEPHYNAANVHYRGEDYETAQQEIEQALVTQDSAEALDESSYYNLGNTFFQTQQYQAAIESYKEALRLHPDDLEAKQNLELALRQLEQQEQQQQDQQQEQEQEQQEPQGSQDQDQQEQEQDQGQEPQDGDSQDRQQDGQNGDQPQDEPQDEQAQDQGQEQQDEQAQDQGQEQQDEQAQDEGQEQQDGQPDSQPQEAHAGSQPQQTDGLSREQARQLLEAAAQGTESLEEYLQQVLVVSGAPPLEDW